MPVSIQPLHYADIPICSQHVASAFAVDPHTIVKQLGQKPYDMRIMSYTGFLEGLPKKTHIYVKAVDKETGDIVGHASWAFRGVEQKVVPWDGPGDERPAENATATDSTGAAEVETEGREETKGKGSIDRLHALERADIQDWVDNQIPSDTPCMFVNGLIVSPSHQSRGVGSALLQHGNAIADSLGLAIWVHSSHQAYEAYKKAGFEVERVLDIDLDEYAPRGPREGEEVMGDKGSRRWGRYIIRYMRRMPKKQQ